MDIVIRNQKDYGKLFQIIQKGEQFESITVQLYRNFLAPSDILILTEFIIYQLNKVGKVNLYVQDRKVNSYLKAIGLYEFCTSNHSETISPKI